MRSSARSLLGAGKKREKGENKLEDLVPGAVSCRRSGEEKERKKGGGGGCLRHCRKSSAAHFLAARSTQFRGRGEEGEGEKDLCINHRPLSE